MLAIELRYYLYCQEKKESTGKITTSLLLRMIMFGIEMIIHCFKVNLLVCILLLLQMCNYYVFTTFHGFNLPQFAPFCLFCDFFNNYL